jgi:ubiquinone/menaquinone biosynthesis C-methylase UbiE
MRSTMNVYNRCILPYMLDRAMGLEVTIPYRERVAARARGVVLEVGIGSGANLPFYKAGVERLIGVDPSPRLLRMAGARASAASVPVQLLTGSAEALPQRDESVDTVVLTLTLCSIPDARKALAEMLRVLKRGGELLFVEHGRSPDPGVARWQDRITPIWKHLAGGCHLNREPDTLVRDAGFRLDALDTGYAPGPRLVTYCYEGRALKDEG